MRRANRNIFLTRLGINPLRTKLVVKLKNIITGTQFATAD
jgi:hypothetical protein